MANFKTHVGVALSASTLAAAEAVNGGLFDVSQSLWYVSVGVAGGMLPDIDSDHSQPVKRLFNGLGIACAGLAWQALNNHLNPQMLALATLSFFGLMRYVALHFFQKMTVHRGVFHSLLAGVFFALLLICTSYYLMNFSKLEAWLSGAFLSFGFLVHLCLDELFSVDLANGRMKKSFGTALKLYGPQNLFGSIAMSGLAIGLFMIAPSSTPLRQAFHSADWRNVIELSAHFKHALKCLAN